MIYRSRRMVRYGGPLNPDEWSNIAITVGESVTPSTTMTVWIKPTPSGGYKWVYEYYELSGWHRLAAVARGAVKAMWRRFWGK